MFWNKCEYFPVFEGELYSFVRFALLVFSRDKMKLDLYFTEEEGP